MPKIIKERVKEKIVLGAFEIEDVKNSISAKWKKRGTNTADNYYDFTDYILQKYKSNPTNDTAKNLAEELKEAGIEKSANAIRGLLIHQKVWVKLPTKEKGKTGVVRRSAKKELIARIKKTPIGKSMQHPERMTLVDLTKLAQSLKIDMEDIIVR